MTIVESSNAIVESLSNMIDESSSLIAESSTNFVDQSSSNASDAPSPIDIEAKFLKFNLSPNAKFKKMDQSPIFMTANTPSTTTETNFVYMFYHRIS